jgi:hypothetical protein
MRYDHMMELEQTKKKEEEQGYKNEKQGDKRSRDNEIRWSRNKGDKTEQEQEDVKEPVQLDKMEKGARR